MRNHDTMELRTPSPEALEVRTAEALEVRTAKALELRTASPEALRLAYERDLAEAFPPQELKPLRNIVQMTARGKYEPLCLYDGGEIAGECFLWFGNPGWALLDYLCITQARRNDGLGAYLIALMRKRYAESVIIAEAEAPEHAPEPALAERRLDFYFRNGAKLAGVDTEIFGVHYKTLYWAAAPRPDDEIWREHAVIYRSSFTPDKYERYIKIPRSASAGTPSPIVWDA